MENLISQLPPMLSGDELTEALYALPTYDSEIRKQDVSNRILALEDPNLYSIGNFKGNLYKVVHIHYPRVKE